MCAQSIELPIRKKSGNLFNGPCSSLDEISTEMHGFRKLSRLSEVLLAIFLSPLLVYWCLLPILPSTCIFHFLQQFWLFLDLLLLLLLHSLWFFSHLCSLVVFDWGLKDSKKSWVSKILSIILVNVNNAVVQIVSIHPLISSSTSFFSKGLTNYYCYPVTIISNNFSALKQDPNISLFFHFLSFSLHGSLELQNRLDDTFFFFPFNYQFWMRLSGRFVSHSFKEFHTFTFLRQILACAYTIC